MIEKAPSRLEVDKQVDVAIGTGFATRDGTEDAHISGPILRRDAQYGSALGSERFECRHLQYFGAFAVGEEREAGRRAITIPPPSEAVGPIQAASPSVSPTKPRFSIKLHLIRWACRSGSATRRGYKPRVELLLLVDWKGYETATSAVRSSHNLRLSPSIRFDDERTRFRVRPLRLQPKSLS